VLAFLLLLDRLEVESLRRPAAHRRDLQTHPPVIRHPERVVVAAPGPSQVRYAHDGEFEPLRGVDRHQPHGVQVLRLERRLPLACGEHVLLGEVVDEGA
jgi:hypothetical protein